MMLKQWTSEFLNLFFPRLCVVCEERLLPEEQGICLSCIYDLPKTGNYREENNSMETLLAGRFLFKRAASFCVFTKGGIMQPIIHTIKYNHGIKLGYQMGFLYGEELKNSEFIRSVQALVPIPLHPKRQEARGYNQAEIIAQGMADALSLPLITDALIRSIHNPTQTKRGKTQRWENVEGIFEVAFPEKINHKHILLVDDVMTTGSTIEASANALKRCEGVSISVATLAQAH